ncbi:MAG: tRNA pseudouridine(55) synthase TruB, partial [Firmicutes bacterium HGW-Firmicutes-13]
MNGFINILKPTGMTSHQCVAYFRKLLHFKKIGHAGTLDPGASGVLPICLGKGTKAAAYLLEARKVYRAELYLGASTDSQDAYGKILETASLTSITSALIEEVMEDFIGNIKQIPPMHSAVKHKGRPLYKLARKGEVVTRKPREVTVYTLDIIDINIPRVLFEVECSKGTYIRTLAADIGNKLGVGAYLSFLLRTQSGPFKIEESFTILEIEQYLKAGSIQDCIIPLDIVFTHLPSVIIKDQARNTLINGAAQSLNNLQNYDISDKMVRVYSSSGDFLALGKWYHESPEVT